MVTTDNYEEYLMMQADNELDAQALADLQAFLDAHPELAAEAVAWQGLKLIPDESIRYAQQDALIREERKAIAFRPWHAAVPAAAALLLALFLLQRPGPDDAPRVAANTAPESAITETPATRNHEPGTRAVPVPPVQVPQPTRPRPRPQHLAINTLTWPLPTSAAARAPEHLAGLQSIRTDGIAAGTEPAAGPGLLAINTPAALPASPVQEPENRVHVQLASANQEALNAMKSGLDQRIEQIGRVAKSVRETTVVLKLGGNAINIHL